MTNFSAENNTTSEAWWKVVMPAGKPASKVPAILHEMRHDVRMANYSETWWNNPASEDTPQVIPPTHSRLQAHLTRPDISEKWWKGTPVEKSAQYARSSSDSLGDLRNPFATTHLTQSTQSHQNTGPKFKFPTPAHRSVYAAHLRDHQQDGLLMALDKDEPFNINEYERYEHWKHKSAIPKSQIRKALRSRYTIESGPIKTLPTLVVVPTRRSSPGSKSSLVPRSNHKQRKGTLSGPVADLRSHFPLHQVLGKGGEGECSLHSRGTKPVKNFGRTCDFVVIKTSLRPNKNGLYVTNEADVLTVLRGDNKRRRANVIELLDSHIAPGYSQLIFDFCDGGDLQSAINDFNARSVWPSLAFALHVQLHLTAALEFIHTGFEYDYAKRSYADASDGQRPWTPIVHRDIKPANILLRKSNKTDPTTGFPDIVLADFGKAAQLAPVHRSHFDPRLDFELVSYSIFSTDWFSPPEYVAKNAAEKLEPEPVFDVWQIGKVLFSLTAGYQIVDEQKEWMVHPLYGQSFEDDVLALMAKDVRQRKMNWNIRRDQGFMGMLQGQRNVASGNLRDGSWE